MSKLVPLADMTASEFDSYLNVTRLCDECGLIVLSAEQFSALSGDVVRLVERGLIEQIGFRRYIDTARGVRS